MTVGRPRSAGAALAGSVTSSPKKLCAGADRQQVRAERSQLVEHARAARLADAEHGDHRRDADRDPERAEERAGAARDEAVGAEPERVGGQQAAARTLAATPPASARHAGGVAASAHVSLPSRTATWRGRLAAISRSWVMTAIVVPAVVQLAQQRDDLRAAGAVERAGRLVGEHDRRPRDDRPRDPDALALAAGQLRRQVAGALREPDPLERLARPLAPLRRGMPL